MILVSILKFVHMHTCVSSSSYETTSSEESSGDEKSKVEAEEEDSSEKESVKEKEKESPPAEKPDKAAEIQGKDAELSAEGGGAVAGEKEGERGLLDPESSQELQEEQAGWVRQQSFNYCCALRGYTVASAVCT